MKSRCLALASLTVTIGCSRYTFESTDYNERGPWAVGTTELRIEDPERPLEVTAWYPTDSEAQEKVTYLTPNAVGADEPKVEVKGHAIADAEPSGDGPFPLVVYSHTNEGFRTEAAYLMEQLASHGLVVYAPNHVGDDTTALDAGTYERIIEDTHLYVIRRPLDITRVLDRAEADAQGDGLLGGAIDMQRVAATGWSLGGFTSLSMAGAQLNYNELDSFFCQAPGYEDVDTACAEVLPVLDEIAEEAGLQSVPEGNWPSLADDRVDAVVAMAPGFTHSFGESGLQPVEAPLLVMAGTADPFFPQGLWAFDNVATESKVLVETEEASHYFYWNSCSAAPWSRPFGCKRAKEGWGDHALDVTKHYVTAFLLAELTDDTAAATALDLEREGVSVRR